MEATNRKTVTIFSYSIDNLNIGGGHFPPPFKMYGRTPYWLNLRKFIKCQSTVLHHDFKILIKQEKVFE